MVDAIVSVRAWSRSVALPRPLRIGPMVVDRREYACVRITCASGAMGEAFAQSRGAPVPEIVERLFAPTLAGADAHDIAARIDDLHRATLAVGRVGLVRRALSLVDLALHDAAGRRAGVPVHALLGRAAAPVEVTYVAGYPTDREGLDVVVAAARAAAEAGHTSVKVARTPDPDLTVRLLDALAGALAPAVRLAIDANWVWTSPEEASAELRRWPLERLAWVEDPFAPEDLVALAELKREVPVPIAAGDELADPHQAVRLLDAGVDVLRLDVATIGGVGVAARLVREAARRGTPVSFHISPESSVHLASGDGAVLDVETFDRTGNPFDPSHELIDGGPVFTEGRTVPSERPGLGFTLR
jgi:L-alanine-DL-glutamate epimerase-like enolase superfamily enzyme